MDLLVEFLLLTSFDAFAVEEGIFGDGPPDFGRYSESLGDRQPARPEARQGRELRDGVVEGDGPGGCLQDLQARCSIKDFFDFAKNVLSADRMYTRDDAHVMGHLFVMFVAALIRYEFARLIDEAGLASSYSPEDVLDVYATMKIVTGDGDQVGSAEGRQESGREIGRFPVQHAGRQG